VKRRHIPLSVKLTAALYALHLDPDNVEWHHEPPISHRPIDPDTGDTDPPMNDARHIVPMAKDAHRERTAGVGGDTSIAAKLKRVDRKHEEFRARILAKEPGEKAPRRSRFPCRPFQKRPKRS
jgi:hypothetical protein